MIFYGAGFVSAFCISLFLFLSVDLGVAGLIGGLFFGLLALVFAIMLARRTYQFVVLENIYGWLI